MKAHALALLPALFASVAAWAAPRETVSLDGAWEVRIDPADDAAKAHPKEAQWFPARVPGSVQQDLIAAGRAPDPFKGINEARIQWAGLTSWQFRRVIEATPAMLARDHVELVFDGLDTFASVTLNGKQLLATDNAHRRWRVDAKAALKPGRNELIVRIASPIRTLQPMVLADPNPLPGEYDFGVRRRAQGQADFALHPQTQIPV